MTYRAVSAHHQSYLHHLSSSPRIYRTLSICQSAARTNFLRDLVLAALQSGQSDQSDLSLDLLQGSSFLPVRLRYRAYYQPGFIATTRISTDIHPLPTSPPPLFTKSASTDSASMDVEMSSGDGPSAPSQLQHQHQQAQPHPHPYPSQSQQPQVQPPSQSQTQSPSTATPPAPNTATANSAGQVSFRRCVFTQSFGLQIAD